MNPIFLNGYSSHKRIMLALVLSSAFIYCDHKLASFETARGYLQSLVSPLQYLANTPNLFLDFASENLVSRKQLMLENQRYQVQQVLQQEKLLQLNILKQENDRLRSLLTAPVKTEHKKMLAEILAVDSDPYSHQVVINRGTEEGIFEGQAVINEQGVVGQVLHVGANSSRVLLLTDITHSIPLRVQRNGVRIIANGTGSDTRMEVNNMPHSTDIKVGDLLVTSGLGGKFPTGYPVAKVTLVSNNPNRKFAKIDVEPLVQFDRIKYLLLIWPANQPSSQTKSVAGA
ncbi:rod shape-determining protein MreC [Thalassotalea aquiviva]|uniref:rod shape-determining protein MreC n=1 Tax=Thalassotalea aquiviva TaxID=3242415 RepID=UPI00352AD323